MRFNPQSNEELEKKAEERRTRLLMEPGIYDFEVAQAQDTVSKSGNDMIKLQLKVWDKDGNERFVFDYLLEAMEFKLRHFAESVELLDLYNAGEMFAPDCVGRCGKVELLVEKGARKPDGTMYPDKNTVKDYVPSLAKIELPFDDTIPF